MPDISSNLGLNLPKGTDVFDYDVHLRQNFQKIDDNAAQTTGNTSLIKDISINVKDKQFGAKGDGITDDTAAIQSSINSLITTGGTVYLPKGTYIVNSPINLSSNIRLLGDGWTNTYIKAGNNANIPTNQGVVQTKDFLPDRNKWDYYAPYPVGLHMGVQLENISIDGNREHLTTGNGLCIYGGKWTLKQVGVINTAEHGIWTEAGLPVSSTSGSDLEDFINMHESFADQVYIANTNKHGWNYRGPNDTYLAYVQVKMAGWAGFYQEDPTSLFSNGGLKIGKLHVYYCDCLHETDGYMIHLTNALADLIYSDTSKKGGVKLMGGDNIKINHIFSLTPNCYNVGDFWGLKIDTPSCIIGQIHDVSTVRNVGTQNGGVVWVTSQGSRALLNSVRSGNNPSGTINSTGVKLEGFGSQIASLSLTNFYVGLDIQANEILVRGDLVTCATGFNYRNTGFGRNNIQLIFQGCTTDYTNEVVFSSNDVTSFISDKNTSSYNKMGTTELNRLRMKEVFVGYVATYTPNAQNNNFVHVAPLTGNITIGAPTNPIEGDEITFYFQQDATGGRTVTWNTVFKTNYSDTGNTASKRYTITFHYDGTVWVQKGNGSGWL
jgi:hypothetical protein